MKITHWLRCSVPDIITPKRLCESYAASGFFLIVIVFTGCANIDTKTALTTRVEALIAPLVVANEFSGAVVLARRGEIVYEGGFGKANHAFDSLFTPHTATDGGSLAKTFTAASIWWLVQEGLIDPDAPVNRYLIEYPHSQTTVRHLLSHSNGLPAYYEFFDPYFAADEVRNTDVMLRFVAREVPTPLFPPGSKFEYSNFGFDVGAQIIERITGKSFATFLQERFFSRLAMDSSFARPGRLADWQGIRTMGYRWQNAAWKTVDVFDMEAFIGASNLYFSAIDLYRWGNANAGGTAIPAEVEVLGSQPSQIAGKTSFINGLSWYCDSSKERCYYTGSINAFHSFVYWDRSRNETAVLVSNSSMPPWQTISLQRKLVDALAGRLPVADHTSSFQRFDIGTVANVAGTFVSEGISTITVNSDASGVKIRMDAGLELDAFQVSPEVFYVPGADYWLAFSGGQGTESLHIRSMFVDTVAHRVPQS